MKPVFTKEDFGSMEQYCRDNHPSRLSTTEIIEIVVREANEKIQMLIESSPVVYGSKFISNDGSAFDIGSVWNITKLSDKTHSARLMFIEEIKKDCKHEPGGKLSKGSLEHVNRGGSVNDLKTFCKHCGIELINEWREVK